MFLKLIPILSFSFFLIHCASTDSQKIKPAEPEVMQANLLKTQAENRFRQIQDVSYFLEFFLTSTDKNYSGKATLNFKVAQAGEVLKIDFYQGQVKSLLVDGQEIPADYNGKVISVPQKHLNLGPHQVVIEFSTAFNQEGRGLSRFEDPEDKNIYVHTQLEPFNANYVFPCFDQPDLKATYEMEVHAPQDWLVVSAVREKAIKEDGDFRIWKFPISDRFSTYVWSLHAGPYKVWEKNFRTPLRLMARQSLAKYVKTEEWFEATQQGFDFYEKYFGVAYPFKKYDQLIVPEFTSGAMENVGAVTFNERFISRGQKSLREKRSLANVILHEMAHMWFGDLVTMKWWNDLWLNESFATYMASLAMTSNTRFKDAWREFYSGKSGAYFEDQMVTTHPIEGAVADTLHAMANFDSITYGKGASVLKQTSFYLTPEKFQKGVQLYFKKHAYQNTTLNDFMGALSEASGKELSDWKTQWLKTAGVNKVEPRFTCENGVISSFTVTQTPPTENPYLRTQKLQMVLLNLNQGELNMGAVIPFEISKASTEIKAAQGQPCPALVYPNYEDHGYLSAILDPLSLKTFSENPQGVKDVFLRQMLWRSLWDLTRDAQWSVHSFLKIAIDKGLAVETDDYILKELFRSVVGRSALTASGLYYLSRIDQKAFENQARQLEELIWKRLASAPAGSESQKTFFDGLLSSVRTAWGQDKIFQLLQNPTKFSGLVINQDDRWEMISTLVAASHPLAQNLMKAEAKKDPSFFGKVGLAASQASQPDWNEKKKWIEDFKSEKHSQSMAVIRTALYSLFPFNQESLREKYATEFFADLKEVNRSKDASVAATFTTLAPIDCGSTKDDRIGPFLKEQKDLQPSVLKVLRILQQENGRCRKVISTR